MDSSVFPRAREEGTLVPQENRMPVEIPMNFTASERETEQRLAYFREDIGVNMHHWHWHLVYPGEGPTTVVNKDRRGELFYFMHNQIIARYNNERFCNRLGRVQPLNNLREAIPEGYFPKIIRSVNNRAYPSRVDNSVLKDLNRVEDDTYVEIADLERWRDRIHQAIDQGYVVEQGTGRQVPLDLERGIDHLGNILENCALSPNRQLYGNLHNMGHNVISYVHDPDSRHLEDYGVMADVATAMRDPIFYRWHTFIDNICAKYKSTLPPYASADLSYDGVTVNSVSVQISARKSSPNVLLTYWQRSDVDLAAGLDFGPGNVYAQVGSDKIPDLVGLYKNRFLFFCFSSPICNTLHLNTASKQPTMAVLHDKAHAASSSVLVSTKEARPCVSVTSGRFALKWTNSTLHVSAPPSFPSVKSLVTFE